MGGMLDSGRKSENGQQMTDEPEKTVYLIAGAR